LEDLALHKVRLSVLWLSAMISDFVNVFLYVLNPAILKSIIETGAVEGEQLTPEYAALGAIMFLIMLVMAFLSLTLKDKANRWSNIVVGAVYLVLWVGDSIQSLAGFMPASYYVLSISGIIFFMLIIWYAYKWPKKKE